MIRLTEPGDIRRALLRALAASGHTQTRFASDAGIARRQLELYLAGKTLPGARSLIKLAQANGYDLALVPREDA